MLQKSACLIDFCPYRVKDVPGMTKIGCHCTSACKPNLLIHGITSTELCMYFIDIRIIML